MSSETDAQLVERRLHDLHAQHATETDLALLHQWKETVEADLKKTQLAIQVLQDERTHALKWGIATLGAAVLAMGSWMWSYVTTHIK